MSYLESQERQKYLLEELALTTEPKARLALVTEIQQITQELEHMRNVEFYEDAEQLGLAL